MESDPVELSTNIIKNDNQINENQKDILTIEPEIKKETKKINKKRKIRKEKI